jgi:hypothetical protein
VLAEALDRQPFEITLAPLDSDRGLLVEVELLPLVIDLEPEGHLPVRRDAVGADLEPDRAFPARFLTVERGCTLQAEHPGVPRIAGRQTLPAIRAEADRYGKVLADARRRHIGEQPHPQAS